MMNYLVYITLFSLVFINLTYAQNTDASIQEIENHFSTTFQQNYLNRVKNPLSGQPLETIPASLTVKQLTDILNDQTFMINWGGQFLSSLGPKQQAVIRQLDTSYLNHFFQSYVNNYQQVPPIEFLNLLNGTQMASILNNSTLLNTQVMYEPRNSFVSTFGVQFLDRLFISGNTHFLSNLDAQTIANLSNFVSKLPLKKY